MAESNSGGDTQPKNKEKKPPREWPHPDYKDRDPNELNTYTKCEFTDVIAEPEGAHSKNETWFSVFKYYTMGQECCFSCCRAACAIPLAFIWGCSFACMTFCHIYSVTPCLRVFQLNCDCAARFVSTMVHCWCDPCYEAAALMFTKIYISIRKTDDPFKEKTYINVYNNAKPKTITRGKTSDEIYVEMNE